MTDLNLQELCAAAQNATQGAWELVDFNEGMCPPRPLWGVANDQFFNPSGNEEDDWLAVEIHTGTKNDAAHIAAFDPPTVLALIARIEKLEAEKAVAWHIADATMFTGQSLQEVVQAVSKMSGLEAEESDTSIEQLMRLAEQRGYSAGFDKGWESAGDTADKCSRHLSMATATIQRVRDLHQPIPLKESWGNCRQGLERLPVCDSCTTDDEYTPYPCPTIEALGDPK